MTNINRLGAMALTACIGMALAGCNDYDFQQPGASTAGTPIKLAAAYPTQSRASDAGFEDTDQMGVYVLDYTEGTPEQITGDAHGKNVRYTFNAADNSWTPSVDLYWTSNDTPADIIGYYPFEASIENEEAVQFSINRRQDVSGSATTQGGYEASDFLWGKVTKAMPTADRVDLTLYHLMAGVRVTLAEGTGFAAGEWADIDKTVVIPGIIPDATIDLSSGTVTTGTQTPVTVTPLSYGGDWRAIVVPQTVKAGNDLVAVNVDGVSYTLVKNEDLSYRSGKMHTFTVTVNKNILNGKYEFMLTDEAVTPWLDSVDFREGVIRDYVIVEVSQKGTLQACIESSGYNCSDILNLKIKGELNEEDFRYIRENMDCLKSLNLYECEVYEEDVKDAIPDEALFNVKTLNYVVFPKKLWRIGAGAFCETGLIGDLIIPEGVTHLGKDMDLDEGGPGHDGRRGVFTDCRSLMGNLSLPSSLEFIESGAFCRTALSGELSIPDNVTFIGSKAFESTKFTGQLSLPDNLQEIGKAAFFEVPMTGNIVIPQGIKVIREFTFRRGKYSLLELPEGLEEIHGQAFYECEIKGELKLPSTLKGIESYAFANNKFSSIVFPESLTLLGNGVFQGNNRLSGTIEIPRNLSAINGSMFEGCTLLEEVVIGENVTKIEGKAFGGCYNLASVIINNPEPPLITDYEGIKDPFHNVPKDNFTLQVPEKSVEDYRNANGWKEFKRIAAYSNFVCRPATACALATRHQETLVLNSDGDWEVTHQPSWCSLTKNAGSGKTELTLTINEMAKGSGNREDYVEFSLKGTDFTTRCAVSQFDYEYGEDECVTLQKATAGRGIDVLFVGDGFDGEAISEGKYIDLVKEQMEAFFGLPPYSTYRDYFNVYACISLSQETGVNTANTWRNTRFTTLYAEGTLMHDDIDEVFDYAVKHSPLKAGDMWKSLIIMSLNSDEYGSATSMTENGSAVAICCPSSEAYPMDTRGIVQHEAGGHAFGKLAEERISWSRGCQAFYPPNSVLQEIFDTQMRGWWPNISISGKMSDVAWSHLIFDTRYSDRVDVFEGAYGYRRGIFRSEINSCMNYGIPYYNAISRQEITRRILEYAGEEFSMDRFYAEDSDKWGSTATSRAAIPSGADSYSASGLHHPVRIIKSKKY